MNDSRPSSRPTACLTRVFARLALVGFAHFASAQTATAPLTVSTFAGQSGAIGSADGTGANATFINPSGLAVDHQGNVFVADTGNDTIRKITPAGVVTTFAGQAIDPVTGLHNTGGRADGTGPAAEFHFGISIIDSIGSNSLAIDANDNLYLADTLSSSIRKITPAGVVTTIALRSPLGVLITLNSPDGVAIDPGGNLYVTDSGNCVIRKITPDGVVSAFAGMMNFAGSADGTGNAATFNNPRGIACDSSGNVYVADTNNNTIRKITPSGAVTTLAGSAGTTLENSAGSSDGLGRNARFNGPIGLALDAAGNLFIADRGNHSVRRLTPAGVVSTVAGLSGVAGSASGTGNAIRFNQPYSIAITSSGNFFVADTKNHVIRKGVVAATSPTVAIHSQPEIRIVNVGQSAMFSVSVSAAPAPSFQWQRNGAAISGATSASYTLGSPQLSDDRTFYSVVVTSGSLSLTSSSAELQVYPPLSLSLPSSS